jgi:transposase
MMEVSHTSFYLSTSCIDFRKSCDGLCLLIREQFNEDPQTGYYIFYNRARDKLKILFWHLNGFVLIHKRLERGRFHVEVDDKTQTVSLNQKQLEWLLTGLDWQLLSGKSPPLFKYY